MIFSEQWLREWVAPKISTDQLSEQLTMAGLEVDAVTPVAPAFTGVVVGQIISIDPHPQADKLQVCEVDVGKDKVLSIVCGASNVAEGMIVPTALVGATLPEGYKIKKAKLRGVESFGMLCSAKELGLADTADGLMALPGDSAIGKDVRELLQLDDNSIEIGLTPNRGDCLGLIGIAREVGVLNRYPVNGPEITEVNAAIDDRFNVEIMDSRACPRYTGRVLKDININVESPLWLREKLRRSGLRSIDPVVDVTNYVMLELGQPMHAFDLNNLEGGLRVRYADQSESITLLDGQEITLSHDTLIVADHRRPLALAGIMGGLDSGVEKNTKDLFIESAYFSSDVIAGKARSYGLHTDSSHRFERGVDPELPRKALERATRLLLDIVGGKAGPIVEQYSSTDLPSRQTVKLRHSRVERILGISIDGDEIVDILSRLDMDVSREDDEYHVKAPSFRFDIEIEADLIEELARIHGYHHFPDKQPTGHLLLVEESESVVSELKISQLLVNRGYQEAITYSFIDEGLQRIFGQGEKAVELSNPIASDMSVMRTSLLPGLVQAVLYNQNRQQKDIKLFELGIRYIFQGNEIKEEKMFSGIAVGRNMPEQWGSSSALIDYYDIKADVEAIVALTQKSEQFSFAENCSLSFLHPGQSANIIEANGGVIGFIGAIHPGISSELGLEGRVFVYELGYNALREALTPVFCELSKFPAIRRDLAIIVDEDLPSRSIIDCINQCSIETLSELQLFDVYQGKGVDSGRKSIALGLTFQEFSRTLKDTEIDDLVERVLAALKSNFNATLRD
ncbi:MAG: phenylalanine--tRNA ligase subunit beta [Gammaproteobacteria bacterium]